MTRRLSVLILSFVCIAGGGALLRAAAFPLWAYGYITLPASPVDYSTKCTGARPFDCARGGPPTDNGTIRHLPGSNGAFTLAQIHDDYGPADWYPGDHPVMPDVVARGKQAIGLRACGLCHYPNGHGKPENGPVAGLPVEYFLRTMADFKNGHRKSADLNKANQFEMAAIARNLTDAETKAAAEYFGAITFRPWVKVVESNTVPKFTAGGNGLFLQAPGTDATGTEPLGQRLIEMPQSRDDTFLLRNPRSGFAAYVPPGSIQKGEMLVTTGGARIVNGKIVPGPTKECGVCHGGDLRGIAYVPPIAGRQASYLVRQLYDMQQGARNGEGTKLMRAVVANLSEEDMIAIAAYVSSREP
jgi:cytochrome c553